MAISEVAARPEDVGVDSQKLQAVFARARRDVEDGTLPCAQVAVARHGVLAGTAAFGMATHGDVTTPATTDTLFGIFSCTKAVVGLAIWQLCEQGLLKIQERVADIVPEFASNGKDEITVEQVLLHISGFPLAPYHPDNWGSREKRLQAFSQWRLNWEPGTRFEYHATSAHWVLAEILERRTGMDFRDYIRQRILDPLGLDDFYVGLPRELNHRVADVAYIGPQEPPPGGYGEVTPEAILNFNRPDVRAAGVPGGGGIATAAGLALFYQALVNGGAGANGARIVKPETIEWATRVRTGDNHRDPVLGHTVNRALSVVVAGDDGDAHQRGFGRTTSPRALGHGGAGGQIAWADPATGISLGYCTSGFNDWLTQGRRITAISSLAATCAI